MSVPMRFLAAAIVATGLLTLANGCGSSSGGGATPEETFKTAKTALEKEDWKGLCDCMTKESQDMMAGGVAMVGVMMQAFASFGGDEGVKEAEKIKETLDKHGLTEDFLKKLEEKDEPEDPMAAMKIVLEPVKDRPQFIADMIAALQSMSDKDKYEESPIPKDVALKDVKIDGDSATGTVEFERKGKKESDEIAFKKVDGKWLLDLTAMIKKQMDGPGAGGPPAGFPDDLPAGFQGELPDALPGDIPGDEIPGDEPTEDPGDA